MDDSKNNQNNNGFDEGVCIKCCDLKSGREELSMVNKGFDKLIDKFVQLGDFIQDVRMQLFLLDNKKMASPLKFIAPTKRQLPMKLSLKQILFQEHLKKLPEQQSSEFAAKQIFSIENVLVFQILNILNVKISKRFLHCLSSRVY